MKAVRKILLILMVLGALGTVAFIALITDITWEQYQDTKEWEDTSFGEELSKVPPFLARNYVKAEDKEAVLIWNETAQTLAQIDEDKGVRDGKRKTYEEILARSKAEQEAYGLTEGEVPLLNERLSLYLELEDALDKAYDTPATDTLKELSTRLYNIHVQVQAPVHDVYFERLNTVANDYRALSDFLSETLPTLGSISEKVLIVNIGMDQDETKAVVKTLEEGNLRKFPFLEKLYRLLTGNAWEQILYRNQVSRAYQDWSAAKGELESLSQSQYYSVSVISTYQQALDAGLTVQVDERDGYTVDPNSPVEAITYEGKVLTLDQYIRYGTPVTVELTETYVPIPEPEEPKPEETPTPEVTPTPTPEETPTPMPAPEETPTPTPGETPAPEETPTPETPSTTPDDGWTEDW